MKVEFLVPAEDELFNTIRYYNNESEGLGYEFAGEVKRTINRIIEHPQAWTPISKQTRRCRMNRFPYGIVYQVIEDTILITAVMHLHRNPESWRDRLDPSDV